MMLVEFALFSQMSGRVIQTYPQFVLPGSEYVVLQVQLYFWRSKARIKEDGEEMDFARVLYFGEYMSKKGFMFVF